jgi:hypothetical protein
MELADALVDARDAAISAIVFGDSLGLQTSAQAIDQRTEGAAIADLRVKLTVLKRQPDRGA